MDLKNNIVKVLSEKLSTFCVLRNVYALPTGVYGRVAFLQTRAHCEIFKGNRLQQTKAVCGELLYIKISQCVLLCLPDKSNFNFIDKNRPIHF